VLLDGAPRRFGGAEIISYAEFCDEFGLRWEPTENGNTDPQQEDKLPDALFVIKPRARVPKRERPAQAVPTRPETIIVKIAIDGVPHEQRGVASNDESVESIAATARADIEQSTCVGHQPHALVEVLIHQGRFAWVVPQVCCGELSRKIIDTLKFARRRNGIVKRRRTLAARKA